MAGERIALSLQDKNIKSLFENVEDTVNYIRCEEQISCIIYYGSIILNIINIIILFYKNNKDNIIYVIYTHLILMLTIISMKYNTSNNHILSYYIGHLNRSIRSCFLQFRIKNRSLELKSKIPNEINFKGLSTSRNLSNKNDNKEDDKST